MKRLPRITETVNPPGPHATAILLKLPCGNCGHERWFHRGGCDCSHHTCACAVFQTRDQTLTARLIADVAAGIRVLVERDGHVIAEKDVEERARNIVAGLKNNYRIGDL